MSAYDVVVVGAGVAGLYASSLLASAGWKVAIVESKEKSKIGDKVCGDAIGVHHFRELNLEVPQKLIDHKYDGVKVYSPSRKHSIVVPGEGVSINRLEFGQWLLKKALDSGAELYDQHYVVDVVIENSEVRAIKAAKVGGGHLELKARAFVDASGYRPAVRSKLPPEWPISERPYETDYNLAYREVVELEEPVPEEDRNYAVIYIDVEIAPGGYWWLFPKSSNGSVANIGLGVVNNGFYNPRRNYETHLKPVFKGRVLHAGGGVVPTRRPIPTLVWRNVATIGDAAYTVNPVHGGGIGSSMLSANIVAKHLSQALEAGVVTEESMWGANLEYMKAYGAKQAGLDVLRMYMQKLSNEDYEWIIKNKIVNGSSVYEIGTKGELADAVVHAVAALIRLLGRPSLLNQLRVVRNYMKKAQSLYSEQYPSKPSELRKWLITANSLFDEYVQIIGYNRGKVVKW
jgi:geranylgeranyl reductase family protein